MLVRNFEFLSEFKWKEMLNLKRISVCSMACLTLLSCAGINNVSAGKDKDQLKVLVEMCKEHIASNRNDVFVPTSHPLFKNLNLSIRGVNDDDVKEKSNFIVTTVWDTLNVLNLPQNFTSQGYVLRLTEDQLLYIMYNIFDRLSNSFSSPEYIENMNIDEINEHIKNHMIALKYAFDIKDTMSSKIVNKVLKMGLMYYLARYYCQAGLSNFDAKKSMGEWLTSDENSHKGLVSYAVYLGCNLGPELKFVHPKA